MYRVRGSLLINLEDLIGAFNSLSGAFKVYLRTFKVHVWIFIQKEGRVGRLSCRYSYVYVFFFCLFCFLCQPTDV